MRFIRIDAPACHRFSVGNMVTFDKNSFVGRGPHFGKGPFEVVAHLPEESGILQYRIKSSFENHQRVAKETELIPSA